MAIPFRDRRDAGRQLASRLVGYADAAPLVLGLARGGVPVAYEVARALETQLDVYVVRKLGAPIQPELAIGAVAEGGDVVLDELTAAIVGVSERELDALVASKRAEVDALCRRYRHRRKRPQVAGRTVILVDDGIATGASTRAAIRALRRHDPAKIVLAAPVAAQDSIDSLRNEADDVVCVATARAVHAISRWYEEFAPVLDDEVTKLLELHGAQLQRIAERGAPAGERPRSAEERPVHIDARGAILRGDMVVPPGAQAVVLFAHGSGSSRTSPRNRFVAERLQRAGLATLLFDLLTTEEAAVDELDARYRFDVDRLARRLVAATDWACGQADLRALRLGYFGASTGAAAALVAAAERANAVGAVVSRGGRPDLAGSHLHRVCAPTLFVVGSLDAEVLQLNREALELMEAPRRLAIVAGATHLFEEPGALDRVADLAAEWFTGHLLTTAPSTAAHASHAGH